MRNCLVYLSGPITAKGGYSVEENVASGLKTYLACIRAGIPAFCPQLGGAFPSSFEVDYEAWIAYDLAMITRCTHMLMLPRWVTSAGAQRERAYAQELGIPVFTDFEALTARVLGVEVLV